MGLFGKNAKIKFEKVSQQNVEENMQKKTSEKFSRALNILDKKQDYFAQIVKQYKNDIILLQTTHKHDPLKISMQKNKLRLTKIYESQRIKLLNIKMKLEEISILIESGTLIKNVHEVLVQGADNLKLINDHIESLDIDSLIDNINESMSNLNESNDIISEINTGNNSYDEEIEKELNSLLVQSTDKEKKDNVIVELHDSKIQQDILLDLDENEYEQQMPSHKDTKQIKNKSNKGIDGVLL